MITTVSNQDHRLIDLYEVESALGKYFVEIAMNRKKLKMEVNPGARYTILPEDKFKGLNLRIELQPTNISFRAYTNDIVPCKGKASVTLHYKQKSLVAEVFVVPSGMILS
jgi:hypothetical protein